MQSFFGSCKKTNDVGWEAPGAAEGVILDVAGVHKLFCRVCGGFELGVRCKSEVRGRRTGIRVCGDGEVAEAADDG